MLSQHFFHHGVYFYSQLWGNKRNEDFNVLNELIYQQYINEIILNAMYLLSSPSSSLELKFNLLLGGLYTSTPARVRVGVSNGSSSTGVEWTYCSGTTTVAGEGKSHCRAAASNVC